MSARAGTSKGAGPYRQEWGKKARPPLSLPATHLINRDVKPQPGRWVPAY